MTFNSIIRSHRGHAADPLMQDAWERQRRRRNRILLAVALVLIAAIAAYGVFWPGGGGSGGSLLSQTADSAAQLPRGAGWYGGSARIPIRSCPRCVQVDSWASTTPYLDAPNNFPVVTMAKLDANDVIVLIIRGIQPKEPQWALKRHPLLINRSGIYPNFEGNPTHGRVSEWLATSWLNGSSVQVYVYFGSPHPSSTVVARAQEELNATSFPAWKTDT